jgi:competence protein ComGC
MNTPPPVSDTLQSQRCGLALWSLVLGIAAVILCLVGPLFAIPAVICGHMAMGRIKRSGGTLRGHGLALAGLITGYLSIVLIPVIALLAAIAIPNFVRARSTAQMHVCINNLRMIDSAKEQLKLEKPSAELTKDNLVPYLRSDWPTCPVTGTDSYTIGDATTPPACANTTPNFPHELP